MTAVDPVFVRDGPLLDWFGDVFDRLAWAIPAGSLGDDLPDSVMSPVQLSGHLLKPATGFGERDRIWAGIVRAARDPARGARFRLLAFGLALPGLHGWRAKVKPFDPVQRADLDADLAHGFLRRLAVIDPTMTNVPARLIDTATSHAGRRLAAHLSRPIPTESEHLPLPTHGHADAANQALQDIAAQMRATGRGLAPADVELIAATRLDGHDLAEAAHRMGIPVPVAYKRRQRAEARLAAHLAPDTSADLHAPVTGDATDRPVVAQASATRPTAAIPAQRAPAPSPEHSAPSPSRDPGPHAARQQSRR